METMLLTESIQKGIVKVRGINGAKEGNYIDYRPERKTCTIASSKSGWGCIQGFQTEKLHWRLEKVGSEVLLVPDDSTCLELYLAGNAHGVEAMKLICKELYSSPLARKVTVVNNEMQNKGISSCPESSYWLGSSFVRKDANYDVFGLFYMYYGELYSRDLYFSNADGSDFSADEYSCSIRPVVSLRSDVRVMVSEGHGSKKRPWVILEGEDTSLRDSSKLNSKSKLEVLLQEGENLLRTSEGKAWLEKVKKVVSKMK